MFVNLMICIYSDYTDFLEDLEEDPTIRQNVNIYKGTKHSNMCINRPSNMSINRPSYMFINR